MRVIQHLCAQFCQIYTLHYAPHYLMAKIPDFEPYRSSAFMNQVHEIF